MVDLDALRRVAAVASGTDRAALITAAADEIGALRAECATLRRQVATGRPVRPGAVSDPDGPWCTCRPRKMPAGDCPVHGEAGW